MQLRNPQPVQPVPDDGPPAGTPDPRSPRGPQQPQAPDPNDDGPDNAPDPRSPRPGQRS